MSASFTTPLDDSGNNERNTFDESIDHFVPNIRKSTNVNVLQISKDRKSARRISFKSDV
jgi:hypothetical protein